MPHVSQVELVRRLIFQSGEVHVKRWSDGVRPLARIGGDQVEVSARIEGEIGTKPGAEVLSMLTDEVNQRRIRQAKQ